MGWDPAAQGPVKGLPEREEFVGLWSGGGVLGFRVQRPSTGLSPASKFGTPPRGCFDSWRAVPVGLPVSYDSRQRVRQHQSTMSQPKASLKDERSKAERVESIANARGCHCKMFAQTHKHW